MIELIFIVTLFGSILGMAVILFRKIPVLEKMPIPEISKEELSFEIKSKIQDFFSFLSLENVLHKSLLKFKILILKTENKTSQLLKKLRKRKEEKKEGENDNDNYWEELKKSKRDN